jgi:large repetitive protein
MGHRMNNNMNYILTSASIFLSFISLQALAGIEGYKFVDTNDVMLEKGNTSIHINPKNFLNVVVSAGLDRKIKVTITNKSGIVLETSTSSVVSVSDRLTFMGRDFYGKSILSSVMLSDAEYIITSELLDVNNAVVGSETKTIFVDKTKPLFGDLWAAGGGAYGALGGTTAADWKLGLGGSTELHIRLLDVADSGSGIDRIPFKLLGADGRLVKEGDFAHDSFNGYGFHSYMYNNLFPSSDLDERFTLHMEVLDKAGNRAQVPTKGMYYDNIANAPDLFGFFDPDSSNVLGPGLNGFVPYVPGAEVKTNPIKMAFKIPKSNWSAYREGGLSFVNAIGQTVVTGEDAEHVYLTATAPFGYTNGNYIRWANFGQWGGGYLSYSLVLADSAPKTPVRTGTEYFVETINQWIPAQYARLVQSNELPWKITKFRFSAAPRTFEQEAYHAGVICRIPIGAQSCEAALNVNIEPGTTGYLHSGFALSSIGVSSPELQSDPTWAEITWNDLHKPIVSEVIYDAAAKKVHAKIEQPGSGAYFDRLRLATVSIKYGAVGKLTPYLSQRNLTSYEYSFDLTSIPDGTYDLTLLAQENHGLTTSSFITRYVNDKTPPTIKVTYQNSETFTDIVGLGELKVTVADGSIYTINSASLTGGPANDTVFLATTKIADNSYALEYPRIYPSLEAGDIYTLTIIATDEYNNSSTKKVSFTYQPPNLIKAGKLKTLAVNSLIKNRENIPVSSIKTAPLRTNSGHLAAGPQIVYFTLRSDATDSVMVSGINVTPGQTVQLSLDAKTDGTLEIAIHPSSANVVGSSFFLIDIPEIKSNYTVP